MTLQELYPLPATIEGVEARLDEVTAAITQIWADLSDDRRKEMQTVAEYFSWRGRAIKARAHLLNEQRLLKRVRTKMYKQEMAANRAAKKLRLEERTRRLTEDQATKEAVLEARYAALPHEDEARLIRQLYAGLCRLYRKSRAEITEIDKQALDAAHAYLVDRGLFLDS